MTANTGRGLPPVVYAEVSLHSPGGVSLFETKDAVTATNVHAFYHEPQAVAEAVVRLRNEGFLVMNVGRASLTIAAPPEVYERTFGTQIFAAERAVTKEHDEATTATFLDCPDTSTVGLIDPSSSTLAHLVEGVALAEPVYCHASPLPPRRSYWHLQVPSELSMALNASRAHRWGWTGRGVRVALVDSGLYQHPHFIEHGYKINPVLLGPAAADPDRDEEGHGTGMAANVLSIAPDVLLTMVKFSFVNAVGALNLAISLNPDVICCSWGTRGAVGLPLSAADQVLAAAIASAVAAGIIVIFSAGNGDFSLPAQHPEVISAGGVFMDLDGSLTATPYASGYASNIYAGRNVPDVCGLVGLPPHAEYIMLPVEPKSEADTVLFGGSAPETDETAGDDGWAAFSGTSAAAAQLAGVCALMKQAWPSLTPKAAREFLMATARDVVAGASSPETGGFAAVPGPDLATGAGLVDAFKAVTQSQMRGLQAMLDMPTPAADTSVEQIGAPTAHAG